MGGVFVDVTRIISRIVRSNPTGIDRVELGYLLGALERSSVLDVVYVVTSPVGQSALSSRIVERLSDAIKNRWSGRGSLASDHIYQMVKKTLENKELKQTAPAQRIQLDMPSQEWRDDVARSVPNLLMGFARMQRKLAQRIDNRYYLHTSHTQLEHRSRFLWARKRKIPQVFFLHDLIPIEYPEFCSPGSRERHEGRMATIAEFADTVFVNSNYTRKLAQDYWRARDMRSPHCIVAPLGVSQVFQDRTIEPIRPHIPYFLCVGTIEPRKNHLFLLNVWRRLRERWGDQTPRLVLVGRRGWENENVVDCLERSQELAKFVVEVSGISDEGLASLMKGASAVLAPSIVEGYDMPVVEALSVGAPVIASDIDAHREVGGEHVELVDFTDGPGWMQAIEERMRPLDDVPLWRLKASRFRALSPTTHVDAVFSHLFASPLQVTRH